MLGHIAGLVFACLWTAALLAYAVYTVIDPIAAREFWVEKVNGGWRLPWNNADAPDFVWTSRVMGVVGTMFFALCLVLLVATIFSGQR